MKKYSHLRRFFVHFTFACVISMHAQTGFAQSFPELSFKSIIAPGSAKGNFVQALYKDSENIIWIACAGGLLSFDGLNLKDYSEGDRKIKVKRGVNNIIEDSAKNLWIGTADGILHFTRKTGKFDRIFYKPTSDSAEFTSAYFIDDKNKLWFHSATAYSLATYDLATHNFDIISNATSERLIFFPSTFYNPVQFIISAQLSAGVDIFYLKNGKIFDKKSFFKKNSIFFPEALIGKGIYIENENAVWMPSDLGLIFLSPKDNKWKVYNEFNNKIIQGIVNVTPMDDRYITISTNNNGIYIFDRILHQFIKNIQHSPGDPHSISSNQNTIAQAFENKILLVGGMGTALDLAVIPHGKQHLFKFSSEQNAVKYGDNIEHFAMLNDSLLLLTNNENDLFLWNPKLKRTQVSPALTKLNNDKENHFINGLQKEKSGGIFILCDNGILLMNPDQSVVQISDKKGAQGLAEISSERWLATSGSTLYEIRKSGSTYVFKNVQAYNLLNNRYGTDIFVNEKMQKAYVVSEWGQIVTELNIEKEGLTVVRSSIYSNSTCRRALYFEDRNIIIFPSTNGLHFLNLASFTFRKNILSDASPDRYDFAVPANANSFYTLNEKGISLIDLSDWKSTEVQLPPYLTSATPTLLHELLSTSDTTLLVSSNNGIITFNPRLNNSITSQPTVYISSIIVDKKTYKSPLAPNYVKEIMLTNESSTIDIFLSNTNYEDGNSLKNLWYTLSKYDTTAVPLSSDGKIHLANLPRGVTMELKIIDKRTNTVYKTLSIYAQLIWYKTMWFRLLLSVLVLGAIITYYRQKIQLVNLKNEKRQKLAELTILKSDFERQIAEVEMSALRSQMNPHFIFNVLNSIQLYILENEAMKASYYLVKFSKLIRLVLENSKKNIISLHSDLAALRLYLEIEKLRFEEKLSYALYVSEDVDQEKTFVPALIIQPFVENAIWHGLMQKEKGGHIQINIFKEGNVLTARIEDDGIGRLKAAKLAKRGIPNQKSYGMEITMDRIAVVNKMYHMESSVEIEDIMDDQGEPAGTCVIVRIPV